MRILTWNTGRGYSAHGQRIAAAKLGDGRVAFVDVDRGLEYVTAFPCTLTRASVMDAYDSNLTRSFPFGMRDLRQELTDAARAVHGGEA